MKADPVTDQLEATSAESPTILRGLQEPVDWRAANSASFRSCVPFRDNELQMSSRKHAHASVRVCVPAKLSAPLKKNSSQTDLQNVMWNFSPPKNLKQSPSQTIFQAASYHIINSTEVPWNLQTVMTAFCGMFKFKPKIVSLSWSSHRSFHWGRACFQRKWSAACLPH